MFLVLNGVRGPLRAKTMIEYMQNSNKSVFVFWLVAILLLMSFLLIFIQLPTESASSRVVMPRPALDEYASKAKIRWSTFVSQEWRRSDALITTESASYSKRTRHTPGTRRRTWKLSISPAVDTVPTQPFLEDAPSIAWWT